MSNKFDIPHHIAKMICEMEVVCFNESIGPENSELMSLIRKEYPELKDEYSFLPWPAIDIKPRELLIQKIENLKETDREQHYIYINSLLDNVINLVKESEL